jgi:hypothetical protein
MHESVSLLVVGLGDPAGLGAAVIERLRSRWIAPDGVHVAIGPLPAALEQHHAAVVVDAIADDAPAGAFVRLDGERAARRIGRAGGTSIVLGLVPDVVGTHPGLSPRVEAGLEGLVRRVVLEARQLGHQFHPRSRLVARVPAADREG